MEGIQSLTRPPYRLGEHETQRDILERALRIMEAEFGFNSHKAPLHRISGDLNIGEPFVGLGERSLCKKPR